MSCIYNFLISEKYILKQTLSSNSALILLAICIVLFVWFLCLSAKAHTKTNSDILYYIAIILFILMFAGLYSFVYSADENTIFYNSFIILSESKRNFFALSASLGAIVFTYFFAMARLPGSIRKKKKYKIEIEDESTKNVKTHIVNTSEIFEFEKEEKTNNKKNKS